MIDYSVASSTASGGSCSGTIFIRGMKGKDGTDAFKFVLEKSVDFADLDAQLFITALEMVNKMQPPTPEK
jgi:hypothetical protein